MHTTHSAQGTTGFQTIKTHNKTSNGNPSFLDVLIHPDTAVRHCKCPDDTEANQLVTDWYNFPRGKTRSVEPAVV